MNNQQEVDVSRSQQIYVSSILCVTVLFFVAVTVPCALAFGWSAGIGLGAMCAVWGGPGFGVMAAGARVELARERAHHDAPRPVAERATQTTVSSRFSGPLFG